MRPIARFLWTVLELTASWWLMDCNLDYPFQLIKKWFWNVLTENFQSWETILVQQIIVLDFFQNFDYWNKTLWKTQLLVIFSLCFAHLVQPVYCYYWYKSNISINVLTKMSFYIEKYQHLGVHFRTVKFANLFKKKFIVS